MDNSADAIMAEGIADLVRDMAKGLDQTVGKLGRPKEYGSTAGRQETINLLRMAKAKIRFINRPAKFVTAINKTLDRIAEKRFAETENPLFAWHAYYRNEKLKRPQPEWISKYFASVAAGLLGKVARGQSLTDRELKKSLGLIRNSQVKGLQGRGRSTAFNKFALECRDLTLATMVECVMKRDGCTREDAPRLLRANWRVPHSASIIRRAHDGFAKYLNESIP